jgi:glycerophosphoryl diester phosphodiesterase
VKSPPIIAHRTCPLDAAENSIEGLQKAADLGADGVEIDLRMSLDQRPYLMHDWTLRRTAHFPLPLELTPSFIVRRLRLSNRQGVPSLGEVLDALPEGLLLAVDVKTPWAIVPLLHAIRRRGMEQRVLVWCQSALAVRYAKWRTPAVEVAYLKDMQDEAGKQAFIAKAKRLGADAISAHWQAIDVGFVAAAQGVGLKVYSYHAGYALEAAKLRTGIDGLITDFPRDAREAFEKLEVGG